MPAPAAPAPPRPGATRAVVPGAATRYRAAARASTRPAPGVRELYSEPVAGPSIGSYAIALLVIVATTVAVLAGGWIDGAQATILVGVVAVVEAILLAAAGLGRLGAALLALPLCAAVVVPTTIGLLPTSVSQAGWEHVWGEYALQAVAGLLSSGTGDYVQWAFVVGLGTLVWACGYWLGWMAFRERRGALAVVPALVVLSVNSLNAPNITLSSGPGSSVGLAETVALFAALLLIGMAQLGALAAGWRQRRVPSMPGVGARFITSMAVAATLVMVASLVVPPLSRVDLVNLFAGLGGPGSGAGTGGSGPAQIGFNPDVAPGGPLTSNPQPLFSYSTSQGGSSYLRVVTDDTFSNGDWQPGVNGQVMFNLAPGAAIPEDPTLAGGDRTPVSVSFHFQRAATGQSTLALYPGEPLSTNLDSVVAGWNPPCQPGVSPCVPYSAANPDLVSVASVTLTGTNRGTPQGLTTTGLQSTATAQQLEAAGTAYPTWVTQTDLQPLATARDSAEAQSQAAAILALAQQWVQGVPGDAYDQATAIENHLRGTPFVYTLTPPATPPGEWPVVHFLEQTHAGYCQYFADAMGAMLRSLGIPARLVSGFGPGTASSGGARSTTPNQYTVTTTDAHVWVEAYFPGYGWIPFEPTPASAFGAYVPFTRGGITPPPATATGTGQGSSRPQSSHTPAPQVGGGGQAGGGGGVAWRLVLPAGAGVVLVGAVLGLLWWRRPRSLAGAWRRLALAGRLSGVVRDPAETRAAFARRLAGALGDHGPPTLAAELQAVAAVSGKAEFAPGGLDAADRETWSRAWVGIARGVTAAWRRRVFRRPPAV
jgi:hypothetical protein